MCIVSFLSACNLISPKSVLEYMPLQASSNCYPDDEGNMVWTVSHKKYQKPVLVSKGLYDVTKSLSMLKHIASALHTCTHTYAHILTQNAHTRHTRHLENAHTHTHTLKTTHVRETRICGLRFVKLTDYTQADFRVDTSHTQQIFTGNIRAFTKSPTCSAHKPIRTQRRQTSKYIHV